MAIKDTSAGYSWLSIALHWIAAITVISLFLLGEIAQDVPKDEGRVLMGYHIALGVSLYLVLLFRVIWRLMNPRPALAPQGKFLDMLAKWVPMVLLAGIVIMLVSGPLAIWSGGHDISVLDLFVIPTPMEKSKWLHEAMEETHEFGANLLFFGVMLHVLGVLKHLIINRDGTLKKMLVPGNRQQ
jgi:cytochrome b561